MDCELLIKNGMIVDGAGRVPYKGHIAVSGGRITDIITPDQAPVQEIRAGRIIEAEGLTVTPGFIDIHSHIDFVLPYQDHPRILSSLLEQGCTTVVGGNCGFSPAPLTPGCENLDDIGQICEFLSGRHMDFQWDSLDSFLKALEEDGLALNLVQLAGHGTLRLAMWGRNFDYPGDAEMAGMERIVEDSIEAGALGLSLGLGYPPGIFTRTRELTRLARLVKKHDALLTVHLRALSKLSTAYPLRPFTKDHNIIALKEMLDLAAETGVKLHLSHFIFAGEKTWPSCDLAIEMVEKARERGVDAAFDIFPYKCGNTTILITYPDWFIRDMENNMEKSLALLRLRVEWAVGFRLVGFGLQDIQILWAGSPELEKYQGKFFDEIARDMRCSTAEAYIRTTRASRGKTMCLLHKYSGHGDYEVPLQKVMAHRLSTFETDAIFSVNGRVNPAAYGTFPRIIGHYQRDLGLFPLEEAIAKMTGRSAERIGLKDRGTLAPGNWADITIFDYLTIKDNTDLIKTEERPSGIEYVFINGQEMVSRGVARLDRKPGRVLRMNG